MAVISENTRLAIKAAIEAGKEILNIYQSGNFEIEIKCDTSPLTKADKAAHKIISSFLEKSQIPILSEEGKSISYEKRKNWDQLWIVDPIDGTKEFIKRNGEFTVNIALIENQTPIVGVIYAPVLAELYFSEKGIGAFKAHLNLNKFDVSSPQSSALTLPIKSGPRPFTIVASASHLSEATNTYVDKMKTKYGNINLISRGSSLKLCMIAAGQADCYPRFGPTMEWDTAAGQAICDAAGFQVVEWETKQKLKYNRKNLLNKWFIAH